MKKQPLLLGSVLLLSIQAALATPAIELETITVTATRTAQTADETLASVTVIDRQEIERRQAQSVQDVLRGVVGISFGNSGGAGKATSLYMRGTGSSHVLVLIDGIKVGSATLGSTPFQHLPIDQIERIEIVRGPRSSLYGSEAIGGVIQIFTRKASTAGPAKPFITLGAGSYGYSNASIGASGRGENSWFSVSASGTSVDGFSATKEGTVSCGWQCLTTEADKDGNRNLSGSIRAGYQFEDGLEVESHILRSTNKTQYDGGAFSGNESESVQQVFGGTLRLAPTEIWQFSLSGGRSLDESSTFKDGVYIGRINTQRDTISLQNNFFITENHIVTLGTDYQNDRVDSNTAYAVTSRRTQGVFSQYQGTFGANDVELSVRRDNNEQFDKQTTVGAAWGYTFNKNLRFTTSYGTAFKAPTFNDLYWPGYGNANLKPEKSRAKELGLSGSPTWGDWSVNVYENRVEQLIAYDASTFAPGNIEQALIRGIEATVTTQIKGWDFSTQLSLLDPKNISVGANNNNVLARRTKESLRFTMDRQFDEISVGATLLAEGKRYDDLANTIKNSGYATIDLRAGYRLTEAWQLQMRIENLLDKEYTTIADYNQAGRGIYVTLRYQP